ncbi:DUF3106 domain-containing protein [Pseudoxanthomonas indica]|uniref:DUF3106 domain-containing protein n=1 Tax=Pseudoxanthomonas indica TaxID=428993 RepID=A0A1T5KEG2_9GAMM|nr:DUF3106 domain-containing protein [Pseudoxanthomonas indica]GGD48864.1 hypothetical protein GCM10007235_20990 [Pseudoxanthomonas indica]SKC62083.1 Protein of unknown function [Pseudoxanthomonas indica]
MTRPSDASTRRLWLLPLLLAGLGAGSAQPMAASMQATVDTHLRAWQAIPTGQQHALQTRLQAWDALPLGQRDDQRSRYQAWLALQETERARLRQSAREFALLPATEQTRLRVVFEHQDAMQQQGWRLGPALGADWPRLQPLFAFVPPGQRADVLIALKQTDPAQRDDLAALAQRIPPQSRDGFRREWLKQPATQRAAWLQHRRNQ